MDKKVIAGVTALGALTVGAQITNQEDAHADEVSNKQGINVDVPHDSLDQAVDKAESTGVEVNHGSTTTVDANKNNQQQVTDQIKNDYQNQENQVNDAIHKQEQINADNAHANDKVDHSGLDNKVDQAQNAGVDITHGQDQTISGSTSDWQEKEDQIKNDYQDQENQLDQVIHKQEQNNQAAADANKHINDKTDYSDLDQKVDEAEKTGVDVVQDEDKTVSDSANNWQQAEDQINKDKQEQIDKLDDAIKEQQKNNQEADKINENIGKQVDESGIDNAIKNAQDAGVNVVIDGTETISGSAADYDKLVGIIKQHYQEQIAQLDKTSADYKQQVEDYKKKLEEALNNNSSLVADFAKGTWTEQQVKDFLKQVDGNVAYITAGKDAHLVKDDTLKNTTIQDSEWYKNLSQEDKEKLKDKPFITGNYHEVHVGDQFKYEDAMTIPDVNGHMHNVDVTFTVVGISNTEFKSAPTFVQASQNSFGFKTFNGDVKYKISIVDHSTGQPVKANLLLGFGDIDYGQYVDVDNADSQVLAGKNQHLVSGDGYKGVYSDSDYMDNSSAIGNMTGGIGGYDPNGQAWFIVPNASEVTYVFGHYGNPDESKAPNWSDGHVTWETGDYLQTVGSIPLPFTPIANNIQQPTIHVKKYKLDLQKVTPTKVTVHINKDKLDLKAVTPEKEHFEYHYDNLDLKKQDNVKVDVHYTNVNYVPENHKDVELGIVDGDTPDSINGQTIMKGQEISFPLDGPQLPANRTDTIGSYQKVDVLDKNVTFKGYKAFKDGKEITKDFTLKITKNSEGRQVLTFVASDNLLKQMNADKSKAFDGITIDVYCTVDQSNTTIKNSYTDEFTLAGKDENHDGKDDQLNIDSNEVTVNTASDAKPNKYVTDLNGHDINGKDLLKGDKFDYYVGFDLSNIGDIKVSDDMNAKFTGLKDKLPSEINASDFQLIDSKGNAIDKSLYKVTYNDGELQMQILKPSEFIKQFKGQKLYLKMQAEVKHDLDSGTIKNQAVQVMFGNETKTNTVTNKIVSVDPTKDVVVSVGSKDSLNNKNVDLGQNFFYEVVSSRPGNYGGTTNSWVIKDKIDVTHDEYQSTIIKAKSDIYLNDGTVIKKGQDITKYFDITYDKANGLTVTMKKDLLDQINSDKNKANEISLDIFIGCKRIAVGDVTNTAKTFLNGIETDTNTVITHTKEPEKKEIPKETPKETSKEQPQVGEPQPDEVQVPEQKAYQQLGLMKQEPQKVTRLQVIEQPQVGTVEKEKEAPQKQEPSLPQTGDQSSSVLLSLLAASGIIGLSVLRRKKHKE